MHKEGFLNENDYFFLENLFGKEHIFFTTKEEMASMNCNVFSISKDVVVSDPSFSRLNNWL